MKWVEDLNNESAQLAFVTNGAQLWAMHGDAAVDRDVFAAVVTM